MKFFKSVKYALQGLRWGLNEANMRIHLLVAGLVVVAGSYFAISLLEWAVLLLCIGVVITAELFNTAIEEMGDAVVAAHQAAYDQVGRPKDIAAAAVLVAALIAAAVGTLVLLPHVLVLI